MAKRRRFPGGDRVDYAAYLDALETLGLYGHALVWLLGVLAFILAVLSLLSLIRGGARGSGENGGSGRARQAARALSLVKLIVQLAGFGLIAWFHLRIRATIPVVHPDTHEALARYAIPPWIEGEKFYFWALLLGFLTLYSHRRRSPFAPYVALSWTAVTLLALTTSRPLTDPLPRLHEATLFYRDYLLLGDPAILAQVTRQMIMGMESFYNSTYMWIHPPLLFGAYAALVPSFAASLLMLFRPERRLWREAAYGYTRLGYLLLTAGLLIGYPWTVQAWRGLPWWWDPKVNMSLMMWLLYTAFLHSHLYVRRPGLNRLTAVIGVVSFLALVVTYLTTYVIPGVHSYA